MDERVDAARARVSEQGDRLGRQVGGIEVARAHGVVDVVVDVREAVDEPDDPALERLRLLVTGVLEDAVAHLPREVEAAAVALEPLDDTQRVLVVAKAAQAALAQQLVECLLPGVAERRMADVVPDRDRLGEVLVQTQRPRDPARDPGRLERVREPGAEMVALGIDEHLSLVSQASEGLRVDDPVAVALKRRPQAAFLLRSLAPARLVRAHGERREPLLLVLANRVREAVGDLSGDLRHRRSAYPARRGAGSYPNVDTCAVRLRRRPADQPVVVCGSGSRRLGGAICEELGVQPARAETMRFAEGTIFVRLLENVRGRDVYVVQSTIYPANDNVVELLFWLDACRRASAASVTAVVPYFSYGKGDKKDEPRVSIRARVLADAIEVAGADRVVTMDLHAPQIQGFFRIPVDDLYAMPILVEAIRRAGATDPVVVSPDSGYAKMARRFARRLGGGFALADKTRPGHDEEVEVFGLLGDVAGRDAVLVDDFVASGGTLVEAAERLVERGARSVIATATHGLFSGDAAAKLAASPIERVIVTDTVENQPQPLGDKVEVVSVAGLFAEAIKRVHGRESISVLFRE